MTSKVVWAFIAPIGSLEIAARCITQSQPSRSLASILRTSLTSSLSGLTMGSQLHPSNRLRSQPTTLVTFLLEEIDKVSSDETLMAGDEDFHGISLSEVVEEGRNWTIQTAQDACPDAQSLFRYSRSR